MSSPRFAEEEPSGRLARGSRIAAIALVVVMALIGVFVVHGTLIAGDDYLARSIQDQSSQAKLVSPPTVFAQPGAPAVTAAAENKQYSDLGQWYLSTIETPALPQAKKVAVLVEKGLPIDPSQAAKKIIATLTDRRGWVAKGYAFQLVSEQSEAEIVLSIASPPTVDRECAPLKTDGYVSCARPDKRVMLNSDRWLKAIPDYEGQLEQYRSYVISHETGHALGFGHVLCPGKGKPAPVMMQQTYGLKGCQVNAWITVA